MIGSVIGDIAGSRFIAGLDVPDEPELLTAGCQVTDGVYLTMAAAKALTESENDLADLPDQTSFWLDEILSQYEAEDAPAGGRNFACSIAGPCGFVAGTEEEARILARTVLNAAEEVEEEDVLLAESLSALVAMAASGMNKEELEQYAASRSYSLAELLGTRSEEATRNRLRHDTEACVLAAFLEGTTYEEVVQQALELSGGDPAVAAAAGAMGEAFYGVPETLEDEAVYYLNADFMDIINEFDEYVLTMRADM